jgi:hypothetical protein
VFTSCTKEDLGTPNTKSVVEPTHVVYSDSIINHLNDTLNLSITIPTINVDVHNLKPSSISKLTEWNSSLGINEVYGLFISFIDDNGNLYEFRYDVKNSTFENLGTGRVQGHTYIMYLNNETINFCNWYQNVPFTYNLFSTTSLSR